MAATLFTPETFCVSTDALRQQFDGCIYKTFDPHENGLIFVDTYKYRLLTHLMSEWGMTRAELVNQFETHTPIHPEVVAKIMKLVKNPEEYVYEFSQDLVRNEKIIKVLNGLSRKEFKNFVHRTLAVDGFGSHKLSCKSRPIFEVKKYLRNLSYSLSGSIGLYDREPDDALLRAHVTGIRRVYSALYEHYPSDGHLCKKVYQVMFKLIKDAINPLMADCRTEHLPSDVLEKCVQVYNECMLPGQFEEYLAKYLKVVKPHVVNPEVKQTRGRRRLKCHPKETVETVTETVEVDEEVYEEVDEEDEEEENDEIDEEESEEEEMVEA